MRRRSFAKWVASLAAAAPACGGGRSVSPPPVASSHNHQGASPLPHHPAEQALPPPLAPSTYVPFAEVDDSTLLGATEALNAFSLDLFLALRPERSFLCSPLSIATGLSLLYAGARESTAAELQSLLALPRDPAVLHAAMGTVIRRIKRYATQFELRIANRVIVDDRLEVSQDFRGIAEDHYGASVDVVDIGRDPEQLRVELNRWVADNTQQMIRDLMPLGSIDTETQLVLLNALQMQGSWLLPFDADKTEQRVFHAPTGDLPMPFMEVLGGFAYAADEHVQILKMEYASSRASMVIVLPKDRAGLEAIAARLTATSIRHWLREATLTNVRVRLPRFSIEPPGGLRLRDALSRLGAPSLFDAARAKLDGIARTGHQEAPIALPDLHHRASIAVDEEGTVAAAGTGGAIMLGSLAKPPPPVELTADRPFLLLIEEARSEALVFVGQFIGDVG